jgi:hypothetical protein
MRAVVAVVALGGCAAPEVALAPVSSTVSFPAVAVAGGGRWWARPGPGRPDSALAE